MILFIIGLAAGLVLVALVLWLRGQKITVKWYNWPIGLVGLVLAALGLQGTTASFNEGLPHVARMYLFLVGLPGLILLATALLLVWWHNRTAS